MFDVSWGEAAVLAGAGLVLIGRRDLPAASRMLGTQVGRIVGLLQGARLRADRFASDHQLRRLQNEFRSGLRELDAVKAELAGSVAGGRGLGALTAGADRGPGAMMDHRTSGQTDGGMSRPASVPKKQQSTQLDSSRIGADYLEAARQAEQMNGGPDEINTGAPSYDAQLAPRTQSVAAVAEEEWEKRGIGFRSIGEGPVGGESDHRSSASSGAPVGASVVLSNFIRQTLIHDQYERTMREQDEALRSRAERVKDEREAGGVYHKSSKA
ncbi:hypothetical protein THAOC_03965 [Thalassiosira oceanica]|uniref:Sec-independent protein translocase protein TatB n=1 Tax=Thalassiosira oceanica TaxID=159749 RepID=K0TPC7_THAOC|nr:hypothetical protein THAOC_03965 [Thalassiosira oceanica]|eukprot:EJK74362.1 hypothetical protein THAOC_03965 [Thalassiosira oceanica]